MAVPTADITTESPCQTGAVHTWPGAAVTGWCWVWLLLKDKPKAVAGRVNFVSAGAGAVVRLCGCDGQGAVAKRNGGLSLRALQVAGLSREYMVARITEKRGPLPVE